MSMINFKRIIQPSVTQNYKNLSYSLHSFLRNEAKNLLSEQLVGGGVFGIEAHRTSDKETFTFFSPPHYKTNWSVAKRDPFFTTLSDKAKETTYAQLYTGKPSIFPIEMNETESFWEIIRTVCPKHINVMYQLLLAYRQDNWKDKLQEQYDDYLNGIEQPSDMKLLRKIQRNINGKIDDILKWEYKHIAIPEFDRKLSENGFRHNIRLVLYGGTKKERNQILQQIKQKLEENSYTNTWNMNTPLILGDIIQNIKDRKLDNLGKQQVLTVSEILPFIMSENVVHIEQPSIQPVKAKRSKILQNPFELLPFGDELKEVNGKQIAEKFIRALKELKGIKGEMVAKRVQSGSTLIKASFDLPKGLKFSELIKKSVIEDLQAHTGMKGLVIEQGEIGEFNIVLPLAERQKVYLRNYIDTDEFREFSKNNPLAFVAGSDEIGNPIYRDLAQAKHLLVAAQTGGGKSTFINSLILALLLTKTPEELQFYMVDIKRVELTVYKHFPQVAKIVTDVDESIYLFKQIISEMSRRYELFEKAEVRDIKSYNNKFADKKLPHIVICIDEYAELSGRNEDIHDYIQTLTQLSRASGIVLVLVTQDPRKEVLPPIIRSNMPSKIAFRCSNEHSYLTFLSRKPPRLFGNGDGVLCFDGQMQEFIRFQGCLITDGDEVELIKRIGKEMNEERIELELPEVDEVEEIEEEETELDKLRKLITETGETRVSQLREIMKININRLNELMKELVDEGLLEKGESRQQGYKLVNKKPEIIKWTLN